MVALQAVRSYVSYKALRPYLPVALLGALVWWFVTRPCFDAPGEHQMSTKDVRLELPSKLDFSPDRPHREYYASRIAKDFCEAHGYTVFSPRSRSGERKVYDLFMVNSEMDLLEIRLNTLYHHVDYFIIVESSTTFQGNPKPLTIRDNWNKFQKYHDKMIYHELEFPTWFKPQRPWDYENLQRDAMYDQVFHKLDNHQAPVSGDVLLVADIDEIPRPSTVLLLRTCNFPRRLTLGSKLYYYSFQYLNPGPEWQHPQATYYQGASTIRPTDLRYGEGGLPLLRDLEKGTLRNAGWHCIGCYSTVEEFLNKMASISAGWMNAERFRHPEKIADAVRLGRDLWGRRQDAFVRIEGNRDVPKLLLEDRERFRYMMNRDGETAGFKDYP